MRFNLSKIRKEKGLSQNSLAKISGVSRLTIRELEDGTKTVTTTKTLCKLADALGVAVEQLFSSSSA